MHATSPRRPRLVPCRSVVATVLTVLAATTLTSRAAEAQGPVTTPAAPETSTVSSTRDVDHRYEGGLLLGVMLPGELSPVNWFRTEAKAAPSFGYDGGYVASRYFLFGAYAQLTPFTFERMSGSSVIGDGDGLFASGGFSLKGRLPLSESLILRAGVTLGLNAVSYSGKTKDTKATFELSGLGHNLGLSADAVWRASPKVGAVAQVGFLSQPFFGSADVSGPPTNASAEGATRDFRFSPVFFVSVGPELFL